MDSDICFIITNFITRYIYSFECIQYKIISQRSSIAHEVQSTEKKIINPPRATSKDSNQNKNLIFSQPYLACQKEEKGQGKSQAKGTA